MGRTEQNGPGRPRETHEWFGTAFHSVTGMHHLDIRRSGNGVLVTAAPAEIDGAPGLWQLRLRSDDEGQGLSALGSALADGRAHVLGEGDGPALLFLPHHPDTGIGTLARVRPGPGPDDVRTERQAQRPMALWAEAGTNLLALLPFLDQDAPCGVWPPDGFTPCPGCARPVYDSSDIATVLGPPFPVTGLCRLCADGTTLRSVRAAGALVPEQQRAVLEAVSAVFPS
ncbi:hypothetical protein [Streptomyces sp. NPDC001889]